MKTENQTKLIIDKMQKYLLLIIFLIVPLVFYRGTEEAFLLIKQVVVESGLFLFGVVTLYQFFVKKKGNSAYNSVSILLLFILFGYSLSAIFSKPYVPPQNLIILPHLSFGSSYFHFTFFLLSFFFLLIWDRKKGDNTFILQGAVFVASIAAFYGLLQYIGIDPLRSLWVQETVVKQRGIFSTFGNSNMLSSFLAGLLPFPVIWFFKEKTSLRKYVWGLIILLFMITILVTGTRSAWLGVIFSMVVLLSFIVKKRIISVRNFIIASSLIIGIVVLISMFFALINMYGEQAEENFFWNRMTSFADAGDVRDVSGRARLIAWDVSLNMIAANPFLGSALGGFYQNFIYYRADFFKTKDRVDYVPIVPALNYTRTHNEYLQTMVEGGLITAIPLFLLIFLFFYGGIRALGIISDSDFTTFAGAYCGLIAIAILAIFSFPFHLALHGALVIFLGSIVAPRLKFKKSNLPAMNGFLRKPMLIPAIVGFLLLISIITMFKRGILFPFSGFFADIQTKKARLAIQNNPPDPLKTINYCDKGLNIDPLYAPLYFYRAQAHQTLAHYYQGKRLNKQTQKQYKLSVKDCKTALKYRSDASIYILWGVNELEQGHFKEAYKILSLAVKLDPSNYNYLRVAGIAAFQARKFKESLDLFQQSRDLDDNDLIVHHYMAALQQRLHNLNEEVIHLDKLWRNREKLRLYHISEIDVALNFANVHRKLGNYDVAISVLNEISRKYPNAPQIIRLKNKIMEEWGR